MCFDPLCKYVVPSMVCCHMALQLLCFLIVGNFYSIILVDVVRLKSYVNCLFDPASVPVRRTTSDNINLIPKRFVSGVLGIL